MTLHPAIRILLLLVFAGLLPWQPWPGLATAGGLLILAYALQPATLSPALKAVYRLRWFFLIIAVLYLGFTPGTPLIEGINWLPTQAGVWLALKRCTVLVFMIFAVYLLLQSTPRLQLAAALTQLMRGLRPLGLKPDRFARRLAAALDAVPGMQAMVSNARFNKNKHQSEQGMFATAAGLISAVETAAQHEAAMPALPELPPLPVWQLLLPAGLLVIGSVVLFTV